VALKIANAIHEPGLAALLVALLIVGGTQLIVTGLIGEYIWRVLEESRRRPVFVVASALNCEATTAPWLTPPSQTDRGSLRNTVLSRPETDSTNLDASRDNQPAGIPNQR